MNLGFQLAKPNSFLSRYVKYYWSVNYTLPESAAYTQRVVPSGLSELIFYLSEKPVSIDSGESASESMMVSGQQLGFNDLKVSGDISIFAVNFFPHSLRTFIDIPLTELNNESIPLKYILKNTVDEIEDELLEVQTFENQIKVIERFLLKRIVANENLNQYDRIQYTINQINRTKGNIDIEYLASESCLSRKQFERTFADYIGTSPKKFLNILRFQHAISEKSKNKSLSLTELAHLSGYYDQAHMVNEFKALSGYTPGEFFRSCEPFSDYFD